MKKYTLFRLDNFGEPIFPVRKEKSGFDKNNLQSGDFLILKSNEDVLDNELITLGIHVTTSGISDNCTYIGDVDVSKEQKLS